MSDARPDTPKESTQVEGHTCAICLRVRFGCFRLADGRFVCHACFDRLSAGGGP